MKKTENFSEMSVEEIWIYGDKSAKKLQNIVNGRILVKESFLFKYLSFRIGYYTFRYTGKNSTKELQGIITKGRRKWTNKKPRVSGRAKRWLSSDKFVSLKGLSWYHNGGWTCRSVGLGGGRLVCFHRGVVLIILLFNLLFSVCFSFFYFHVDW